MICPMRAFIDVCYSHKGQRTDILHELSTLNCEIISDHTEIRYHHIEVNLEKRCLFYLESGYAMC